MKNLNGTRYERARSVLGWEGLEWILNSTGRLFFPRSWNGSCRAGASSGGFRSINLEFKKESLFSNATIIRRRICRGITLDKKKRSLGRGVLDLKRERRER